MSVKVFITIDTEEDTWDKYSTIHNPVDNIVHLPMLQDIFDRYGAVPTYLIDWPVIINNHSRHILQGLIDRGQCEIGTHCHPWNTPPFEEQLNNYNSMLCNLPYELIMKKITTLHSRIISELKITPVCFRAGRYGFDSMVAQSILKLGYQVDSSVSPFSNWTVYDGPDFSNALTHIYRFDPEDILRPKTDGCLLEAPPSIGFLQKNFRLSNSIRKWIIKRPFSFFHLLRILDTLRIINFRWLSPELCSGSDMIRLSEYFINSGHNFLNMSFHSTSLLPGKSPFIRNQDQLDMFYNNTEMFLKHAVDNGMEFLPLSGALGIVK